MKRDMDLVRKILLALEERNEFVGTIVPEIDGYSKSQIFYHIKLMAEADLVVAHDFTSSAGPHLAVSRLTTWGHDFLDSARSESIWEKANEAVLSTGSSLTVEALKFALMEIIKSAVKANAS